jgi:hypothetical protein
LEASTGILSLREGALVHMNREDIEALRGAKRLLESPSLAVKLTDKLGSGIERGMKYLPANFSAIVDKAVQMSLGKAMDVALYSMGKKSRRVSSDFLHKAAAGIVGGVGGFFGWASLPAELPASTVVMLRSIADIAAANGEDLSQPEAKLSCLEVFALGGPSKADDGAETGYYMVRGTLAAYLRTASRYLTGTTLADAGAPALSRFVGQVASRFGVSVSDKVAASAVPVLGAASCAAINLVFTQHFQNMANGHFTVRRLERTYGQDVVKAAYEKLSL